MMDDMRLLRRLVLCVSMVIVWGLLHVGCALMDEADRISTTLFHESNYPWLLTDGEWLKRSPDEQEKYRDHYLSEMHQRRNRSTLLFLTGMYLMALGIPATILGTEYLLSKMVD
jgi:hypothetical protein